MIRHYFFKKSAILIASSIYRDTSTFSFQKGDFCGTLYKGLEVWRDAAALVTDRRGH